MRKYLTVALGLFLSITMYAQQFFNLTAEQVKIDSVLPYVSYSWQLGEHYADSIYEVSIVYPEFIDMDAADVKRYYSITLNGK